MGKPTDLKVPSFPTHRAQGMGGYHSPAITEETHKLVEEVPSLGIAGDMVMALCEDGIQPTPNFKVQIPEGAMITRNLTGNIYPVGPQRPEIKQQLAGQGITAMTFPEYERNTRFNMRYMKSISDIIGTFETFQNDKICFARLTSKELSKLYRDARRLME